MGSLNSGAGPNSPQPIQPTGSLAPLLQWRVEERPEFPFLWVESQGPWTFGSLATAAVRLQERLVADGATAADRVLVRLGNDERFLPTVMAVWAIGATAILMHPAVPGAEIDRVAETMAPRLVVAGAEDEAARRAELPVVGIEPIATDFVEAGARGTGFVAPDVPSREPAFVLLTSGSTGAPKGVVLSHGNAWANLQATVSAFRSDTSPTPLPSTRKPPNVIANPVSHTSGIVRLLFGLYVGRSVVMLRKFNAAAAVRAIAEHGIDNLTINPTMLRMLLDDLPDDAHLYGVRYVSSGSAPLPEALRLRFEERFGVPVLQSYGQTESFGAISIERATDVLAGKRRPGSVGKPLPGITVRVVGDDGQDVAPAQPGELWARSPAATSKLLAAEGQSPVDEDGWLHTGDMATIDDDGYIYIVGRKRNVIICGGFNIVPEELEGMLLEIDGVRDGAVVPIPDDRLGELPVALIEGDAAGEAVTNKLAGRVAPYKRPRQLFVVDQLPRLPTGKVDKVAAERLAAELVGELVEPTGGRDGQIR